MAAPPAETGAIEPYYTDVQAATANLDLRVEPELIGRIEDWIDEQRVPPSFAAAVVYMLETLLDGEDEPKARVWRR